MRKDTADLFGAFISFALWGFYVCLFIVTLWAVRSRRTDRWNSPMMIAILILFSVNFFVIAIDLMSNYYEYIPTAIPPSQATNEILNLILDLGITSSMVIADSALCYRLYVIWLRDFRVMILPILSLLALLGLTMAIFILDIIKLSVGRTATWNQSYQGSAAALLFVSLGLNWLVTILIVGRLWWADRSLKRSYTSSTGSAPTNNYIKIMIALIESGAFYSVILAGYMIANWVGDGHAQYLFTTSLPIVVGIVPTLIMLQRSLGYLQPNETRTGASTSQGNSTTLRPSHVQLTVRTETHTEVSRFGSKTVNSQEKPRRSSQVADDRVSSPSLSETKGEDYL